MKRIVVIAGTRPEIIKLAPVVRELKQAHTVQLLLTGQHDTMAEQALRAFGLEADSTLQLMHPRQTPLDFLSRSLLPIESFLKESQAELVIVQGDTASAFAGALCAFHLQIPVAHVEAGLRTHTLSAPFPEEGYRQMISRLSTFHFCPTTRAEANLTKENASGFFHITGNTVVDALQTISQQLDAGTLAPTTQVQGLLELGHQPLLLVTGHRRENHHQPLEILCEALLAVLKTRDDARVIFPVHLNPNVYATVHNRLAAHPQIELLPPLDYISLLAIMRQAQLIITDSGGIQEEAPSLGVYTLVTRTETERPEAIEAGAAELAPLHDAEQLSSRILQLLEAPPTLTRCSPFGDGTASAQIAKIIAEHLRA